MSIWGIRHGPVNGHTGAVYGWSDVEPLDSPERMLATLKSSLDITVLHQVFSSDLRRCLIPAQHLADSLNIELRIDPNLREQHFGTWEGLTWNQIKHHEPENWARFFDDWIQHAPPGGESFSSLARRVERIWQRIQTIPQPVLIVGHTGPLRVMKTLAQPSNLPAAFKSRHADQFGRCDHYQIIKLC